MMSTPFRYLSINLKTKTLLTLMEPIYIDYLNSRRDRQKLNNQIVFDAILNQNEKLLNSYVNPKEFTRVLEECQMNKKQLLDSCRENDLMTRILAGRVSKIASKQGTKDETTQINVCHSIASQLGINVLRLGSSAFRPTKTGEIISENEQKERCIPNDMCLKSFDARLTGRINGWVFAKVVFGSGGHQDNVFAEADELCEWVGKFKKDTPELYVMLIDTDQVSKVDVLKKKYNFISNLLIVNHYDFQKYLINNYKV
jgi:hypothetical protein